MWKPCICAVAFLAFPRICPGVQFTAAASVDSRGFLAKSGSQVTDVSADGRFVVLVTRAKNLVGATVVEDQVVVQDRQTAVSVVASVNGQGALGNGHSPIWATISDDGRYVAFWSLADNLVPDDTNLRADVFLRDLVAGTTERLSLDPVGGQVWDDSTGAYISGDGRFVAFESWAGTHVPGDNNYAPDVFVRDVQGGTTERVTVSSLGAGASYAGVCTVPNCAWITVTSLSYDGRYIAFGSAASNLVPGDTNGLIDVFLRDRLLGTTTVISADPFGTIGNGQSLWPSISATGDRVAFESFANNLVPGDTNGQNDVFVHYVGTGTTVRASVDSSGLPGNGQSSGPQVTGDGQRVVFWSLSDNLVSNDTNGFSDVFQHDLVSGATVRISVDSSSQQGNGPSTHVASSTDGQVSVFDSLASNLILNDTNAEQDVFVHDRGATCAAVATYCTAKTSKIGCSPEMGTSGVPSVSGSSHFLVTCSRVPNNKVGLFFWGTKPKMSAFFGGSLCVQAPLQRTPVQPSGGLSQGASCSGKYSQSFDAGYMAARNLGAGVTIYGQYWGTDHGTTRVMLSDAIAFQICP